MDHLTPRPRRLRRLVLAAALAIALGPLAASTCQAAKLTVLFTGIGKGAIAKLATDYRAQTGKALTIVLVELKSYEDPSAELARKPDIYIGNDGIMGAIADQVIFADLGKLVPKATLNDVMPTYLDAYSVGPQLLALPLTGFYSDLIYNTKTFADSGLAPPTATWTWEGRFYAACTKLSKDTNGDGVAERWGVVGLPSDSYSSVIYGYGGSIVDRRFQHVQYLRPPASQAISFVAKLHSQHLAEVFDWSTYTETNAPFDNGKSAMELSCGCGEAIVPLAHASFTARACPVPRGPKGSVCQVLGLSAGILNASPHKADAAAFIKYLLSVRGQATCSRAMKCPPATLSALKRQGSTAFANAALLRSYMSGLATGFRKDFAAVEQPMWDDVLSLAQGAITQAQFEERARARETTLREAPAYAVYGG